MAAASSPYVGPPAVEPALPIRYSTVKLCRCLAGWSQGQKTVERQLFMPTSSVVVRSLALAALGFGAAAAHAQTANVTAFNPYNGVGLARPAVPAAPTARRGLPMVEQAVPMAGPAFNPWQQGPAVGWGSAAPQAQPPAYSDYYNSPGSYLPSPPPGPIESRLVAIPQRGDPPGTPRALTPPPAAAPAPAPVATPQVVEPTPRPPEPVPIPRQPEPARAAPAAPPAVASVAPAPPPPPVATVAPPPPPVASVAPPPRPEPTMPPPPNSLTIATVAFAAQSAEISDSAKAELNRVAKNLTGFRQIEVRAYAAGGDPAESRKIALARALVVRSYLIDQGVKTRIEIGAFTSGGERVDITGSSN